MKKWFIRHKSWWSSLTSTFIGSLLGIGITFAISDYIQTRHQNRMSKRLLLMAVKDMYRTNQSMLDKSVGLFHADSVFWTIRNYHIKKKQMPKDSVKICFNVFRNLQITSDAPSFISNILKTNVEILDVLEDLSVINDITKIYDLLNMQEQAYEGMKKIRQEIYDYNMDNRIQHAPDLQEKFVDYQFEFPKMSDYLIMFHMYAMGMKQINQTNKQLINQLQMSLEISDDELRQLNSRRLEAEPVIQEQKKTDLKYKQSIRF